MEYRIEDSVCSLWGSVVEAGSDIVLTVFGGTLPHVGTTVLALPRPSLCGGGTSATVSCLNRLGHMDDALASPLAKGLASAKNCAVVCVCGVHVDEASQDTIEHVVGLVPRLAEEVLGLLDK